MLRQEIVNLIKNTPPGAVAMYLEEFMEELYDAQDDDYIIQKFLESKAPMSPPSKGWEKAHQKIWGLIRPRIELAS